ncbi:prolyl oligopeptidase family serine peptidase [Dyella sp. 2HG41-7]|uniref:prolyl oligopeptidase family serine peptidase n=1 Tax=Dyella sp. 2HG41-7 TaxID=2883239 RepID=UPI001F1D36DD|nr:prolyl oligopeptidase family serine peptidase [Dyella sp. 2HG41-7]
MYTVHRSIFVALALTVASAAWADTPGSGTATLPPVHKVDVVDHDFGLVIPDPYRWMEGENNAEFNAWLKAQGDASRAKLDALPTLADWRKHLAAAASATTLHRNHVLVGKRLFFLRAPSGKEGILMVRDADGRERTLFDPNTIKGGASIGSYTVSDKGDKVGVTVGLAGNEIGELAVVDVATGKRMTDTLKPVWDEFAANWLPDGSGFFYTRMRDVKPGDTDPLQGMSAWLHKLGQPQSADKLLARAGADDVLKIAANDFPAVGATPGSDWAILVKGGARAALSLCVAPLADAIASHATWRCIVNNDDNVQDLALHANTLYLLSAKNAPNRRIVALDLRDAKATMASAKVVVPERSDSVLTGLAVARDGLYVKSMHHGLDHVQRMDYASGALASVVMPGEGTISLMNTDPRQDGALLSLESWTAPMKVYRYDGHALVDTGLGTLGAPAYPDLVAEEIEATSADGTKVPLSVIHRRDLALDGHARAIVRGYGGYGISMQAAFSPMILEWAQANNVVAICHVRGGGENGDAWRLGGTGPNKQRGVEDFTACAKELAKRGYSSASRTGGFSGSMGGILAGGAYTSAPESWGAMAVQSGIFNPVRLLAAKNGANQIAEMGDPRTATGMKQLLAMDPYQHVRDGVTYPPLLLITGAVDQRVAPWNSGKFGAQVMTASPHTPVWFRTQEAFGHFATNMNSAALEVADIYAFFDDQLQGH